MELTFQKTGAPGDSIGHVLAENYAAQRFSPRSQRSQANGRSTPPGNSWATLDA
jgi:hypothetical protein